MELVAVLLLTLSLSIGAKDDSDHKAWTVDVLYHDVNYPTMEKCLSMLDGDINRIEAVLRLIGPRMQPDRTTDAVTLDKITGRCVLARKQDMR
jgi:hypothetical protein